MAAVEVDVAAKRSSRLVDAVIGPHASGAVSRIAMTGQRLLQPLEEHVIAPRAPVVQILCLPKAMIDRDHDLPLTRQAAVLNITRGDQGRAGGSH